MNRLHISIFAVVVLLGQWSSLEHDYHQHDSAEVCDFCLSAQALDHAITSSNSFVFTSSFQQFQLQLVCEHVSKNSVRHYAARAPPRFI